MASLSQLSLLIQKNNKFKDLNIKIDDMFIQKESIPEKTKNEIVEEISTFKYNEIIEIPSYFHFLDKNNYYLYGTPNMFYSVLFIIGTAD